MRYGSVSSPRSEGQGMSPSASGARLETSGPARHGLRFRDRCRVAWGVRAGADNEWQTSHYRSHPSWGRWTLPGPSACVGRGPLSAHCEGGPGRRMGDERHRSVRAQGGRIRWSGMGLRSFRLLLRGPQAIPGLGHQKAGPRVAPRDSRRAGNGELRSGELFPAHGFAAFPEK